MALCWVGVLTIIIVIYLGGLLLTALGGPLFLLDNDSISMYSLTHGCVFLFALPASDFENGCVRSEGMPLWVSSSWSIPRFLLRHVYFLLPLSFFFFFPSPSDCKYIASLGISQRPHPPWIIWEFGLFINIMASFSCPFKQSFYLPMILKLKESGSSSAGWAHLVPSSYFVCFLSYIDWWA